MALVLHCLCGRILQIKDEHAGQEGQCPACGRILSIPHQDEGAQTSVQLAASGPVDPPSPPSVTDHPTPRRCDDDDDHPSLYLRNLCNHRGDPLLADIDFFVPAPHAIGPLRSAWSTLREGQRPLKLGWRLLLSLAVGVGSWLLLSAGAEMLFQLGSYIWWGFAFGIAAVCLTIITLHATRFAHTCTYVGRYGVAQYACFGSRENLSIREVFLFRDAVDLRKELAHNYQGRHYESTNLVFYWCDAGGRPLYSIGPSLHSKKNAASPTHYLHFARAAESAWTDYLLADIERQLQEAGSVMFKLRGGQWICLGKRSITLGLNETPVELDAAEVETVQVQNGVVRIERANAEKGWFSSDGVYKFDYDRLANGQLFLILLKKLVGVKVQYLSWW